MDQPIKPISQVWARDIQDGQDITNIKKPVNPVNPVKINLTCWVLDIGSAKSKVQHSINPKLNKAGVVIGLH